MRTTNQIICAVKECQPATEEELRLALTALSAIEWTIKDTLQGMIDSIRAGQPMRALQFRSACAQDTLSGMFHAIKSAPDVWLGANHTPGTPEQREGMRIAKAVVKKATGIDLDAKE